MKQPLVSIVIDNYNYGRFLGQAIDSALHQTYSDTEVIVVDDGSTDNSRGIIATYGDRVVPVLKENGGQASCFNAGFARARGELVMFLDSDDVLLPHVAERAVELFRTHTDVGTVQFRLKMINAGGVGTGAIVPPRSVHLRSGDGRRYAFVLPGQHSMWPSTSGTTYSARTLAEILPMPENPLRRITCADGYVSRAAGLLAPILVVDEVGASYRTHGLNTDAFVGRRKLHFETLRLELVHWAEMYGCLEQFAESRRGNHYARSCREIEERDVSFMTLRMASRKLVPPGYQLKEGGAWWLAWRGVKAVSRCSNFSFALKCLHFAWFGAMAIAPRPVAFWLAERKLCSER